MEGELMPADSDAPGVFIEEVPRPRAIQGVPTSVCAFVGRAARGPVDTPVEIRSFVEFAQRFGGLWTGSLLGFAVRDFFANGGSTAVIVRVFAAVAGDAPTAGQAVLRVGPVTLVAANPGSWGNQLRVRIDHDTAAPRADLGETAQSLFNLTVLDGVTGQVEEYRDVTVGIAGHPRDLGAVLAAQSDLLSLILPEPGTSASRPESHQAPSPGQSVWSSDATSAGVGADPEDMGSDGGPLSQASLLGTDMVPGRRGLHALDDVDLFSLLVVPPYLPSADVDPVVVSAAHAYCERRRAILVLDGPTAWSTAPDLVPAVAAGAIGAIGANAAVYFPRIRAANPLHDDEVECFPAAGAVAGVLARTDARWGVWKAPAGRNATLLGASGLDRALSDAEIGGLTQVGVNCLREVPFAGPVVWGARTAAAPDAVDWKYVPVRRTALFVEESVRRGTEWVVFEPNGEQLWAAIRSTVGSFLDTLFRAGAFHGPTPDDAYFVRCDRSTTTQADLDRGVVTIIVGFAPLKPAEFVIIRIQRSTAQPSR